jgi:hypothetical protein
LHHPRLTTRSQDILSNKFNELDEQKGGFVRFLLLRDKKSDTNNGNNDEFAVFTHSGYGTEGTMTEESARGERLQIMLTPEELEALDNWRFQKRMPSRAAAVRELLKRGLSAEGFDMADGGNKSRDFGVTGTSTASPTRDRQEKAGE